MINGIGITAALELAAGFAVIAQPSTDGLLKLWPAVTDRSEFARLLLAPAFAREHRTDLDLDLDLDRKRTLEGVGHLTTLRHLRISRCKDIAALDEWRRPGAIAPGRRHSPDRSLSSWG